MRIVRLKFAGNLPDEYLEFDDYEKASQFVASIPIMQFLHTDPEFMSIERALILPPDGSGGPGLNV